MAEKVNVSRTRKSTRASRKRRLARNVFADAAELETNQQTRKDRATYDVDDRHNVPYDNDVMIEYA